MDYKKIEHFVNQDFSNVRILVDFSDYDKERDTRLLIPFSYYQHYGLMNKVGEVVLEPKYDRILDTCSDESDVVRVGVFYAYGLNGAIKSSTHLKTKWGLVNSKGDFLLKPVYKGIGVSNDKRFLTILHMDGQYEVISIEGDVIVPKGTYSWIDTFDNGLARINHFKGKNKKWGIIDTTGKKVLPLCYSNIWNFYNKNRTWITIEVIDEHGNKRVGKFNLISHKVTI